MQWRWRSQWQLTARLLLLRRRRRGGCCGCCRDGATEVAHRCCRLVVAGVVACAEWFVNGGGTAAAAMEMRTAAWWCHRTSTNAGNTNLQKNHLQQRNHKPAPSFSSIFARTSSYNEARKRNSVDDGWLMMGSDGVYGLGSLGNRSRKVFLCLG